LRGGAHIGGGNAPKTSLRRVLGGPNGRPFLSIVITSADFSNHAPGAEVVGKLDQPEPGWARAQNPGCQNDEWLEQHDARRTVHPIEGSSGNHLIGERRHISDYVPPKMFCLRLDERSKILFTRTLPQHEGSEMETVGLEAGYSDVLESLQSASAELSRSKTVTEVADSALRLALRLTRSTVAFIALVDEGDGKQVFSMSGDALHTMPEDQIESIFAADAALPGQIAGRTRSGLTDDASPAVRTTCTQSLEAGGQTLGTFGVANPGGYSAVQLRTFGVFAEQVALTLGLARLNERRQGMVDALVNLRADLDRSERQRLINDERARSAERVEHAHEAAVDALLAVSRHARSRHGLPDFYRRLTHSIADLVGAGKVLFWQRSDDGMLVPIAGAHGIENGFLGAMRPVPCDPDRDDLASRVVFHDLMFRTSRGDKSGDFQYVLDALQVESALAVPWRAGDQRLGLVAAYDSRRAEGFSREDAWVLQKAGLAAGLVWQLKYAETDLKKTVERLQKVDAARQMLLKNVSTAVDKARKRFAGDLHDDALQKLTAVELQLQRLREPNGDASELLAEAEIMLAQTEEALRRLLFEVRPPALEIPGGFLETIRDRLQMLRSLTGAEVEVELDLPNDALPAADRSTDEHREARVGDPGARLAEAQRQRCAWDGGR
jgi:signal transduction histidine kinase